MKIAYNILKKINRIMAQATGALVAIIVLLLIVDTFAYVFGVQIYGMVELSVIMVIASAYLGLSYTEEKRGHIRVTALVIRFPAKFRQILNMFWEVVAIIAIGIATYAGYIRGLSSYRMNETLPGLVEYPLAPIRFVIAFCLLLYFLQITANLIQDVHAFIYNDTGYNK